MSTTVRKVECPGCGRSQPYQRPDTIYWCDVCQCQFDDQPGEGGSYSSYDPSWRMQREERRRERGRSRSRR